MPSRSCSGASADWSGGLSRAATWKRDTPSVLHHPERGEQPPLVGHVLVQVRRKARAVGEIVARLERVLDDALERLAVARRDAGILELLLDVGGQARRREQPADARAARRRSPAPSRSARRGSTGCASRRTGRAWQARCSPRRSAAPPRNRSGPPMRHLDRSRPVPGTARG